MLAKSETIVVKSLGSFIPGAKFLTENICVSLQLNYTLTGGNFSISLLQGNTKLPIENTVLTLPFGRVGIVQTVGQGFSSGGMVDIISGPILPLQANLINFFGVEPGFGALINVVAGSLVFSTNWQTLVVPIKNFSFRGKGISGLQQLANAYMLADVIIRNSGVYVVDPGQPTSDALTFAVPKSDLVSATQLIDYSNDVASILNPALTTAQLDDEGDFFYDGDHAQKQPKFTVQSGAPGSQGSSDFIPIPDGWLVDGNYEEWTPPSDTDFTNPDPSISNGRYWKVYQSPSNSLKLRGITNFKRLIKELKLPGNVSTFVGSPITSKTKKDTTKEFTFNKPGTESGIYGFTSEKTTVSDIVSGEEFDLENALVLIPNSSGNSGDASLNFYSITMEMWTFPRVRPDVFGVGDPVNPYGIPSNVVVVTPNSNIPNIGGSVALGYWRKYLSNFQRINSPRLRTNVSVVFRDKLPQPGDKLTVDGVAHSDCGTIRNVSINFGRSGLIINITAEKYQYSSGLWSGGSGTGFSG